MARGHGSGTGRGLRPVGNDPHGIIPASHRRLEEGDDDTHHERRYRSRPPTLQGTTRGRGGRVLGHLGGPCQQRHATTLCDDTAGHCRGRTRRRRRAGTSTQPTGKARRRGTHTRSSAAGVDAVDYHAPHQTRQSTGRAQQKTGHLPTAALTQIVRQRGGVPLCGTTGARSTGSQHWISGTRGGNDHGSMARPDQGRGGVGTEGMVLRLR